MKNQKPVILNKLCKSKQTYYHLTCNKNNGILQISTCQLPEEILIHLKEHNVTFKLFLNFFP